MITIPHFGLWDDTASEKVIATVFLAYLWDEMLAAMAELFTLHDAVYGKVPLRVSRIQIQGERDREGESAEVKGESWKVARSLVHWLAESMTMFLHFTPMSA